MTIEPNTSETADRPLVVLPVTITDIMAEIASENLARAALRPANKAAVFAALAGAGIATVAVTFDGCVDSGQIEDIEAMDDGARRPPCRRRAGSSLPAVRTACCSACCRHANPEPAKPDPPSFSRKPVPAASKTHKAAPLPCAMATSEFSFCKGAAVTDPIADIIARLDTLEAHVAGQEQVIADLNEVVTTQWRKIERLERLARQLRETMLSLTPARDGPEPPPPHY